MSKSQSLSLIVPKSEPGQIATLLIAYGQIQEVHHRLKILFQAAQGACLLSLQELYRFTRGGDRKSEIKPASCGFDSWEAFLKAKLGMSDDTAQRRIKLCRSMVPLMDKLPPADRQRIADFLQRPQLHLTPVEVKALEKVTHKIAALQDEIDELSDTKFLKKPRKSPTPPSINPHSGPAAVDEQKMVQEEFYLPLSQLFSFAEKTVARGKDKISPLALIPRDRWISHRAEWMQIIEKGDSIHGVKK